LGLHKTPIRSAAQGIIPRRALLEDKFLKKYHQVKKKLSVIFVVGRKFTKLTLTPKDL